MSDARGSSDVWMTVRVRACVRSCVPAKGTCRVRRYLKLGESTPARSIADQSLALEAFGGGGGAGAAGKTIGQVDKRMRKALSCSYLPALW